MKKYTKMAMCAALCLALAGCLKDSDGEKVGSITRLSRDGFIPFPR